MQPQSAILVRVSDWGVLPAESLIKPTFGAVQSVEVKTLEVLGPHEVQTAQWSSSLRAYRNTNSGGTGLGVGLFARIHPPAVRLLAEALNNPEWVLELSALDRSAAFNFVSLSFNPSPEKYFAGPVFSDWFMSSHGKLHKWRTCNRNAGGANCRPDELICVSLAAGLKVAGNTSAALTLGDLYLRLARRDERPRFFGTRTLAVDSTTPANVVGGNQGCAPVQYVEVQNPDPAVYLRVGGYGEVSISTGRRVAPGASIRLEVERADAVYVMRESGTGTAIIEWGV